MLGATDEQVTAELGEERKYFLVDPENWEALNAFLSVGTQWARGGIGDVTGLDYTRVRDGLEMAGIAVTPELWQKLRVIESGVLAVFAKKDRQTERK